jgi:hypothetical protein
MQAKIACRVAHGVRYLWWVYAEMDLRRIQPSNPSAEPNSQTDAGTGMIDMFTVHCANTSLELLPGVQPESAAQSL